MAKSLLPLELSAVGFEAGGKRLIHDLSLRIETGPPSIILGPNGAGKSLLLRLCHGLIEPSAGRVAWANGNRPGDRRAIQRGQAMVFQRPVLLRRSAAANVAYPLRLRGVARQERESRS